MGTRGCLKGALLSALVIASLITPLLLLSPSPVRAALTPHAPIYINGNAGFTKPDPVNGGGSGTENDPYVIENYIIDATSLDPHQLAGIEIRNTNAHFVIRNCYVHDGKSTAQDGIRFYQVSNGKITDCIIENNRTGANLQFSSSITVENCRAENNSQDGIFLYRPSSNNTITNCTAKNNLRYGIFIGDQLNNNTITNCTVENNDHGIHIYSSSTNNTITNCTASNNNHGIYFEYGSNNNTVTNCIIENNSTGIFFGYSYNPSNNNSIYHNNFVNNENQAHDECSNYWDDGYPSGGNYWDNYAGVDENRGENQDIPGSDGIGDIPYDISGGANQDRYPLINPVVNGLVSHPPIYINGNAGFIPANGVTSGSGTVGDPYIIENWAISAAGNGISINNTTAYFTIRNCLVENGGGSGSGILLSNVINGDIENCTSKNYSKGIYLSHSDSNTLHHNCLLFNNSEGISVNNSYYNILKNNSCANNGQGIKLEYSSYHTLTNNTCSNNTYSGILVTNAGTSYLNNNTCDNNSWAGITILNASSNHTLTNNTCSNNGPYGIRISGSSNNRIYHNNLVNNATQAYDAGTNYWDNGYPSGGNYWSDYIGPDANGDGIGDTPYDNILGGSNQDNYPLMNPWPVPHLGTAVFSLVNLYTVNVEKNLYLENGSKIVVKFYTYGDAFENENVIETFVPLAHVEENESARHPEGIGVKKARLDLTTDNTENVISTITSFTVTQTMLEIRFTEIPLEWALAQPPIKVELEIEFTEIPLYWALAPD